MEIPKPKKHFSGRCSVTVILERLVFYIQVQCWSCPLELLITAECSFTEFFWADFAFCWRYCLYNELRLSQDPVNSLRNILFGVLTFHIFFITLCEISLSQQWNIFWMLKSSLFSFIFFMLRRQHLLILGRLLPFWDGMTRSHYVFIYGALEWSPRTLCGSVFMGHIATNLSNTSSWLLADVYLTHF